RRGRMRHHGSNRRLVGPIAAPGPRLESIGGLVQSPGPSPADRPPPTALPMTELENELTQLIVSALSLEDVDPASIDLDAPLFGGGLGLDSIDALELSVVLSRQYGVSIKSDDEKNREIFSSVRSLAA